MNRRPTLLTYEGDTTADYSDLANLRAVLIDGFTEEPLPLKTVRFVLGTQSITVTTNLDGLAQVVIPIEQDVGLKNLAVIFDQDSYYDGSSTIDQFQVTRETSTLQYLGDTMTERNQTATLRAQLSETDASPGILSGKQIDFFITDGINIHTASATTDQDGVASTSLLITNPVGLYSITASFAGDNFYSSLNNLPAPYVIWEVLVGLNTNGAGWVPKDNQKCKFGFTSKYVNNSDVPKGHLRVRDKSTGQDIKSEHLEWLVITLGDQALLQGSCTIDGESGHTFRMIVSDLATPGKGLDYFELEIDGATFISEFLGGGNIVIH